MLTKKAQLNSEILKWILMILIFAVVLVVIIMLQQGLPETVNSIVGKLSDIL